jgi:hypothetical protein
MFVIHDDINGVKIDFTSKASAQVGFGIGSGIKFFTLWAKKPKIAF